MKPYYQDEWVTIYHGDCREILPQLPKVDLVLTDPPYELENYRLVAELGLPVLAWCGLRTLPIALTELGNSLTYRGVFAYVNQTTGHMIGKIINKTHFLLWFGDNKMLGYLPNGYMSVGWGMENNSHKWAKNPRFIEKAIVAFANASDIILDPFLGNGVTSYCAKKLNRKCIGIEIEEKYCEIAAKRCSQQVFDFSKESNGKR